MPSTALVSASVSVTATVDVHDSTSALSRPAVPVLPHRSSSPVVFARSMNGPGTAASTQPPRWWR
jgi:hypothetical protein